MRFCKECGRLLRQNRKEPIWNFNARYFCNQRCIEFFENKARPKTGKVRIDDIIESFIDCEPTLVPPGPDKVEVMRRRHDLGQKIWHEDDIGYYKVVDDE